MKVKDLLMKLQNIDPESDIVLQKDAEGNGYSPLYAIDNNCVYIPETTYSGIVYSLEWTSDDAMKSNAEWNEIKKLPRCVVLTPTN